MSSTVAMFLSAAAVVCLVVILLIDKFSGTLNIKSRPVGDGQYGSARWATNSEIQKTFRIIPYEPQKWRRGLNRPIELNGTTVLGYLGSKSHVRAIVDTSDSNTIIISPPGGGKTTCCAYPNIELTCACGLSFLGTDSKGDEFRDYAGVAQQYYGYTPYIIDLRNPTRSHGYNLLHLVNKYMDRYQQSGNLKDKARAERYAKITAKTIVHMEGFTDAGQNSFFYDAAEGLIASTILLVSEFCEDGERHIVSVFKLIQELLQSNSTAPAKTGSPRPKNEFQKLLDLLPPEHKARWFAGAALNSPDASMHSVMSTAMSRMLSFIDSELEQILCFDSEIDAEQFCRDKVAVFIVFPEEDMTKYFMVSLFVTQLYNECLTIANQDGKNKLDRRVMFYLDELGTMPKIDNLDKMFTAGRSRNIIFFPMIQSLAQLDQNYGHDGTEIILDSCQNALFGGQAPLSKHAEDLSRMLGTQTVQSGSISHSGDGLLDAHNSQNLQMVQKSLVTADQLKTLPKNQWVLTKTHCHPMTTTLKRYNEWNITLDQPFQMPETATRKVHYASTEGLRLSILDKYPQYNRASSIPVERAGDVVDGHTHRRPISTDMM